MTALTAIQTNDPNGRQFQRVVVGHNVDISNPSSGDVLVYDGVSGTWRNGAVSIATTASKNFVTDFGAVGDGVTNKKFRGTWQNTDGYHIGDLVNYSGASYLAIQGSGSPPKTPGVDTAYWRSTGATIANPTGTDNSGALLSFNAWAVTQDAAGKAVRLEIPSGIFLFNLKTTFATLQNIRQLTIAGAGRKRTFFQNIYQAGEGSGFAQPFMNGAAPNLNLGTSPAAVSDLINSTAAGDSLVTLVTAGNVTKYSVGDCVLISSLDIQNGGGGPPNLSQFDFAHVLAVDAGTGKVYLDTVLRYKHLSTFPSWFVSGTSQANGQARIWNLELKVGVLGSSPNTFDIDHLWEDFAVLPNVQDAFRAPYISFSGWQINVKRCDLPAISPSVCREFNKESGSLSQDSEPDKIVQIMTLKKEALYGTVGFQSSSIDFVSIEDCLSVATINGQPKNMHIKNSDVGTWSIPSTQGMNLSTTIENSLIRNASSFDLVPYKTIQIDAPFVTYASGVFTVQKNGSGLIVMSGSPVPGQRVAWQISGISNSIGNVHGIVTSLTEDGSNVYINTTLTDTSVPSWANNFVGVLENNNVAIINSSGCDEIRGAGEATRRGKSPYLYRNFLIANEQGSRVFNMCGTLVECNINIISPSATPGNIQVQLVVYDLNMANAVTLNIQADQSVKGHRKYKLNLAQPQATVTLPVASPGVVGWTGHKRNLNDPVYFTNAGGALPTGLTANTLVYVQSIVDADHFQASAAPNGAAINFTGSQSGTHTGYFSAPNFQGLVSTDTATLNSVAVNALPNRWCAFGNAITIFTPNGDVIYEIDFEFDAGLASHALAFEKVSGSALINMVGQLP